MLLRRALRTLRRAARRVATLLARGVAPTGGGTGSPALFALFRKKGRPGGNPKNQSRRGQRPLRTNPRTRRVAEGNGRPFPSRASVALHSVKGLSRHILAAARLRYSTFPLTAFPRSIPDRAPRSLRAKPSVGGTLCPCGCTRAGDLLAGRTPAFAARHDTTPATPGASWPAPDPAQP